MGRVSLVFPLETASALQPDVVARCREALESAGHEVEVLAVLDPAEPLPDDPGRPPVIWLSAAGTGLASAALAGLIEARGDVRLVLDPTQGYLPDDLARTVEPILASKADLVVARRATDPEAGGRLGPLRIASGWAGRLALNVCGATNPLAGLVAVSPALVDEIAGTYLPVGSRFTVDLLLRAHSRKAEVTVRGDGRQPAPSLGLDDIRHLKRLADDRFGDASRLLQFSAVGASGMVIDLSCYALFQLVFKGTGLARMTAPVIGGRLDLAVSGALAIALALTWNFSLNRRLTFSDARSASILRQFVAYAMSNALGIALSLLLRLTLPAHIGFFDRHKLAAAFVGIVAATGVSFSLSRWVVFRHRPAPSVPRINPTRLASEPEPARSSGP
jgi:dolichol-phosphate mannosyltransferase